ncbi:MAG: hypothetical protein OEO19_04185 [Gammaproteobacteria bacterium]|nr:hypothetical protein [Gammaproteobacteria bacterium]MDH3447132.1 hypothetical protein [Gammaproteobacteria bacterium]
MRYPIILLTCLALFGCASKNLDQQDAGVITKLGIVTARQEVSRDEIESDSRTRTSVYGSISSGGGVSIGIGLMFSQLFSGGPGGLPLRYEVDFEDGGQITIYHDSRDFEIGDCVEITVHPDEDKHPPKMKRNKGACQPG